MTIRKLVELYLRNTEKVIQQVNEKRELLSHEANDLLDHAERYLQDAVYYENQKRFETALASVAYCEGLLDALRMLGMVEFQWPQGS